MKRLLFQFAWFCHETLLFPDSCPDNKRNRSPADAVFGSRLALLLMALVLIFSSSNSALAQSTLKSSNYVLDGLNFGSNFTLTSGQSSVPPAISADGPQVLEITPTTAKVFWRTDKKSSSTVQYGQTTGYGQETGSSDLVTEHTITVFGLLPETAYHYRVKSVDAFNASSMSSDKIMTTPAEAGINSIKIADITYDSALVSWTTGLFALSKVEYGTSTKYGASVASLSRGFTTDHTLKLSGLSAGSDYHYRIVAEDEKGNVTRSSDAIFATIANPSFVSIKAAAAINETVVSWTTNTFTSGVVSYTSVKDGKQFSAGDPALTASHSITLKNLFGQSDYTYALRATDSQGKQVDSGEKSFTTQTDTVAPTLADLKVAVTRSGEDLVLTVTWKTNEPATNKVTYLPKTNPQNITELPLSASLVSEHVVVSTGLLPSTPYTLKAISADAYGNASDETINFVTPGLRKSILQLVLDNILKSFGPFAKLFE